MRHARFRPLLLVGASLTVLPALIEGPAPVWVVVAVALVALTAVGVWLVARARPLPAARREQLALAITLVATAGLLVTLAVDGRYRPEAYLLPASAMICSLSSVPARPLRWSIQSMSTMAMAATLLVAGRPGPEVALAVVMLVAVAGLAELYATELLTSRRAEVSSRGDAERRAELLQAVRDLGSSGVTEAMAAAVRTLRALGHTGAGVAVLRSGSLELACVDGMPPGSAPLERRTGLAWKAMEGDRTVVTTGDAADPRFARSRPHSSVVVAPMRVAGEPVGVVFATRAVSGAPGEADVEVVEVLAAHLGGMLDTEGRVQRQRELLDRMAELERMRTEFVMAVSSELRDPLTVVRGVGQTLVKHANAVDVVRRHGLLERMCVQAAALRRTIDALLDFSRFQAERDEAKLSVIGIGSLLSPVAQATGVKVSPSITDLTGPGYVVQVDASVVRHALKVLIVTGGPSITSAPRGMLIVEKQSDGLLVHVERDTPPSVLVQSLAGQLLVVGGARLDQGHVPRIWMPHLAAISESPS